MNPAKPTIEEFTQAVLNCPDVYLPKTIIIDHGPRQRGQGRRSGGTVKGGMSDAPSGKQIYNNPFANLPDFREIARDFHYIPRPGFPRPGHYLKARDYGLDHYTARLFCLDPQRAYNKIFGVFCPYQQPPTQAQ